MSLTIYKSSAGSGKTYTLAREYLKLALRSKDYYKQILAVTFTNRAAQEMKERVLHFLIKIAKGEHELVAVYAKEMKITEAEVQYRAKETLTHLLHHYGSFSISTIDTFFHRVIRAFSREIGLQGSFGIELDTEKVAEFIASDIFTDIDTDPQLKEWLIEFAGSKLSEGDGYEIRKELGKLAKELFTEKFKGLDQTQFADEGAKEKLRELKEHLQCTQRDFESKMARNGRDFLKKQEAAGIASDDFFRGKPIPNFFSDLTKKEFSNSPAKTVLDACDDASKWVAKSNANVHLVIQFAEQTGMALLNEAMQLMQTEYGRYVTAKSAIEHLYTLGLLSDLSKRLQAYKQSEEVIMISDLPDFLSQIIDDSDSPFIYEKVGNRYKHFLIDEFQDTSRLQWRNFKPLLEESLSQEGVLPGSTNESIIVGDAKQSIYSWRGGDPSLLLSGIQADFPHAKWVPGSINYRSAKQVVEFNNALFSNGSALMARLMGDVINPEGAVSFLTTYEGVEQHVFDGNKDVEGLVQVEFIAKQEGSWKNAAMIRTVEIIEGLLKDGHDMNDIAMLVRTNREAADLVDFVLEHKRATGSALEVISDDGMLLRNSPVVQLLLSAFRHLIHPKDASILTNLVYAFKEAVEHHSFNGHADFQSLTEESLPESFKKHKSHLLHLPIFEMTEVLIRCFGLEQIRTEFAYLQAFQDAVLEYSKNHRSDVRLFLEWWDEIQLKRSVKLTGALGAVEIITSHKAKGLQYPIVIVPFCNFDMDSIPHTAWFESPFDQVKSLPVDYKSMLENTAFAPAYKDDLAKWHLESLNVLYVAFTRAERGLIALCEPPPKEKNKMYSTASKLLWSFFEEEQPEGWDAAASVYRVGTLDVVKRKLPTDLIQMNTYRSNKWSNKLTIRKTGRAYYDDEVEKQRNEGILLHEILSEITHWQQADDVLARYEARNQISISDTERYGQLISRLWENEEVKEWFSSDYEVKTEVVVLPKDGETKRIDRVIIKDHIAKVIDFKNGQPKKGDETQVREYVELLRGMGYETSGYVLYLKDGEVKRV